MLRYQTLSLLLALLLLVSAYVGDEWHRIYDYALSHDFRFLSYGDSSLLIVDNK